MYHIRFSCLFIKNKVDNKEFIPKTDPKSSFTISDQISFEENVFD